jgi:hypothetical protein
MVSKAEDWRARATECEQQAAITVDPEIKNMFEQLAGYWRKMAEQAQRHGL